MNNDFKNKKIKPIMTELAKDKVQLMTTALGCSILLLIIGPLVRIKFSPISAIVTVAAWLFFFTTKDLGARQKHSKMQVAMCIVITSAFLANLVADIFLTMKFYTAIPFAWIVAPLIGVFMAASLYKATNGTSKVDEWLRDNFYSNSMLITDKKPGDAQLGHDTVTGDPVLIPYKDRFVHMLILGPTGCGKTSQVIIPMINEDIQNDRLGVLCLEPKGDLADKVFALAKLRGRECVYFNPMMENCPYFNPLVGDEDSVIENLVTTFKTLAADSKGFFADQNEILIRKATKIVKRIYGDKATLRDIEALLTNYGNQGMSMIKTLKTMPCDDARLLSENSDLIKFFQEDYFTGISGDGKKNGGTKTYEHTSGVRVQIAKLNSNSYVSKVLNPPKDVNITAENFVDFDKVLRDGGVISMTTCQGSLRDLSKFLGYFLILQIQSAVFRRPGNEDTRGGCMLYIDEFQTYANKGFADMLTQGRSYRVGSILATQNRALIGMNSGGDGKSFIELVSTNARNVVVFPGANAEDANFYSKQFGEDLIDKVEVSVSTPKNSVFQKGVRLGSENTREKSEYQARFRATDITYKEFGEIIYSVIQENSLKRPGAAHISWIPATLNAQVNDFIQAHNRKFEMNNGQAPSFKVPIQEEIVDLDFGDFDSLVIETPGLPVINSTHDDIFDDSLQIAAVKSEALPDKFEGIEVDDIF